MSTFDKLIEQRKKMRVKQIDICRKLNIGKSVMSKYESGDRKISAEVQDSYADCLGYELKIVVK